MQLLYDNGIRDLKDLSTNWFVGFQANRTFTDKTWNLGVEIFKKKEWSLGSRWRYDNTKKTSLIDNKGLYSWKNWKINGFNTIDISNKLLLKSGLLFAHIHSE